MVPVFIHALEQKPSFTVDVINQTMYGIAYGFPCLSGSFKCTHKIVEICLLLLVSTFSNKETQFIGFVLISFENQGRLR